ncbi:SAM-dependent methyltransferase [Sphingomonas populi]|uniref:site-specific DNA-methyltransferase (adenine-specific) n=1 Tax=Sphingomonas populi TaxID=2484750 RepID=A0A4Q6XUT1_9SPHN|nr:N-6 DNA methylase [Sphingomonas populi]RZF63685.1 SAM-dependent methyltransferase [Sphingomonas populi]
MLGEEQQRGRQILALARAASGEVDNNLSVDARAAFCLSLLDGVPHTGRIGLFTSSIEPLAVEERHYWTGVFYTLLLSAETRRTQATYFTPPYLANAVLDLAIGAGFNLAQHDVLDPAAGGAAFLSTIAARMQQAGLEADDIVYRLNGIEIDPGLAAISRSLIQRRLGETVAREMIVTADALRVKPLAAYNLVVANPPYGRLHVDELPDDNWKAIAHSGHINKYAVFTEYCFRMAKPNALLALVIPSSFRAGPLYDRMRSYIRSNGQVVALGSVDGRKDVFVDVAQDVSVLLVRKGASHKTSVPVSFPVLGLGEIEEPQRRRLPADATRPWPTPAPDGEVLGGATLADYGITVRAGYFVWNREQHRMAEEGDPNAYPLMWAKNVKAGKLCRPAAKKGTGIDFVTVDPTSSAIVRGPAIVMQRTTNTKQPRRLICSRVAPAVSKKWNGFITENHTIILTGADPARLKLVEALLNTAAVDARYRRVSGTASISVTLLRELDLPLPNAFAEAMASHGDDAEIAAVAAYGSGAKTRTTEHA